MSSRLALLVMAAAPAFGSASPAATFRLSAPDYTVEHEDSGCTLELATQPQSASGRAIAGRQSSRGKWRYRISGGRCTVNEAGSTLEIQFSGPAPLVKDMHRAPIVIALGNAEPPPPVHTKPVETVAKGRAIGAIDSHREPEEPREGTENGGNGDPEKGKDPPPEKSPSATFASYVIDMTVPESPAFTLLNVSPETVKRPANPRELAAAVIDGVDASGKPKAGVALSFAPYQLLNPRLSLADYANPKNHLVRILANTNVSVGTSKGTSEDDKSMQMALGVEVTLFDEGDVRTDKALWTCVADAYYVEEPRPLESTPTEKEASEIAALRKANAGKILGCLKSSPRFRASQRWNKSSASVAYGQSWNSDKGEFRAAKSQAKGAWGSYAYGFTGIPGLDDKAQLILHARKLDNERAANPAEDGKFINQDSTVLGARIRFGSSYLNGSFEWSHQRLQPEGGERERIRRRAWGIEYKVAENVWLVAAIGGESGRKNGENQGFVMGGLRMATCVEESCRLKW